ncbi:hypothetical protein AbraIFM66951_003220 [Aspergillus brasiliensis]|uniref:Uncharacterized protein n=1 Tax=Aspergillus brasiliensis TaxID=319629 RepID=A0A9W5Z0V0_9EURO|nr:hypothetical protein AbraCBS73388_001989 [Aspergillus brasiliensis]GKZ50225.1 hypothetical protein AbraIFM66951_003220 [Aspergillus brasiliensis]
MSPYPTPTTPITHLPTRDICTIDNIHFYRRKDTTEWLEYQPTTPDPQPSNTNNTYIISLLQTKQGPGEPLHWSLFVARENQPGRVYQVTGDAEFMVYEPEEGVELSSIEDLCNVFVLGEVDEDGARVVESVAGSEVPPRARCRREVKENCQGWVVRVVERLVGMQLVKGEKVGFLRGMVEDV